MIKTLFMGTLQIKYINKKEEVCYIVFTNLFISVCMFHPDLYDLYGQCLSVYMSLVMTFV